MSDCAASLSDTGGTLWPWPQAEGGAACCCGRLALVVVADHKEAREKSSRYLSKICDQIDLIHKSDRRKVPK